jgi:ryanodine receptor 2
MQYRPSPIDTNDIELPDELVQLRERLAENAHDLWAAQRIGEGWCYGPARNDGQKQHPCLVAYSDLPETEKEYDRLLATGTLKAILALGFRIGKSEVP